MKKIILFLFFLATPSGVRGLLAQSVGNDFLPPRITQVQHSNLTTGECVQYTIGQQAQGGTVIWVEEGGFHGLVAAPSDIFIGTGADSDGISYVNNANSPGANEYVVAPNDGIYGGQKNTDKIIKKCGWVAYAAFFCRQISNGSYGDWYLPSLRELLIMYNNRNLLTGLKTAPNSFYWSSTESSNFANKAFIFDFGSGASFSDKKYFTGIQFAPNSFAIIRVRAIRKF